MTSRFHDDRGAVAFGVPAARWFPQMGAPLVVAAAWALAFTSDVGVNLVLFRGFAALMVVYLWAAALVVLAFRPSAVMHQAAAVGAVLVLGGRAYAFLKLVLEQGRTDLWLAVGERVGFLAMVVAWHMMQAARLGIVEGRR